MVLSLVPEHSMERVKYGETVVESCVFPGTGRIYAYLVTLDFFHSC